MDDRDEALTMLTASLDEFVDQALKALTSSGIEASLLKVDYMTNTAILELAKPAEDKVLNEVGVKMRNDWPEMPDVNAVLHVSDSSTLVHFIILQGDEGAGA